MHEIKIPFQVNKSFFHFVFSFSLFVDAEKMRQQSEKAKRIENFTQKFEYLQCIWIEWVVVTSVVDCLSFTSKQTRSKIIEESATQSQTTWKKLNEKRVEKTMNINWNSKHEFMFNFDTRKKNMWMATQNVCLCCLGFCCLPLLQNEMLNLQHFSRSSTTTHNSCHNDAFIRDLKW